MKKTIKILAAVAAVLLIAVVLFFYNAFCGNPISALYGKYQITRYIKETYPDAGYQISAAHYNFKSGNYYCLITDPDSPDGNFTATFGDGDVTDSYEIDVEEKENILRRLEEGFRGEIDPLVEGHLNTQPRDENQNGEFGFGTITGLNHESNRSALYRDMTFDVKNMPVPTLITVCLRTDGAASLTRVQHIAAELRSLGYRIDYYTYSDSEDHYFEEVPTEELLAAQSPNDLANYLVD